jgi:glycosyltransferase involved in cell wall biosynthesis
MYFARASTSIGRSGNNTKYHFIISITAMAGLKKRIAIASVLKPVNDTRMTEKIAFSLADDTSYELHVIGFPASIPDHSQITFHPLPPFKRLSVARWLASFRVLKILLRIKPQIVVITTHELIGSAIITRAVLGSKIVYDVQENYALNIRHTSAFPRYLRPILSSYVRLKESLASLFMSHFLLAEKVYARQLSFVKGRCTVIENKVKESEIKVASGHSLHLVFTGTLSKSTGVLKAVEIAKLLHNVDSQVRLTLVGFTPNQREQAQIRMAIANHDFIRLLGGDHLVSHTEVMNLIGQSGAGFIAYEQNEATRSRIPTKLYEYLGAGLPIIFVDPDPEWVDLANSSAHPYLIISGENFDADAVTEWLKSAKNRGTPSPRYWWKNEESKLKTALSAL